MPAASSWSRDSSIRTSTSSTAASGSPRSSCATRRRARNSSRRIKAFAATVPPGTWIQGGDWDHSHWGGQLPTREWIDAVTPNHPVWINRLDGHMSLANSAALKAGGVTSATANIDGGEIVRAANGEPTGVLKDNAMSLIDKVVPPPSPEMEDRALLAAMKYVNERGLTSVHNMGTWRELDTFARARKNNTLTTRIYAAVPLDTWQKLRDAVQARTYGGRRWPRGRAAARWRTERIRRRLARLAHGRLSPAVQGRTEGSRPPGQPAGGALHLDLWRRQGQLAGDGPRHRRSRQRAPARYLRAHREGERLARPPLPHRARAAPHDG